MASSLPKNVRRFAWLYWAAALIIIIGEPFAWLNKSPLNSVLAAVEGDVIYTFFLSLIFVPFFWLAVWKRKNWARWVLLAASVVSLPFGVINFHGSLLPLTSISLGLLSSLVDVLAFYLLFTGDARAWFNQAIPAKAGA